MNFIPRPLVQPAPSTKAYGKTLARMLATARKREKEAAKPKPTQAETAHKTRFD